MATRVWAYRQATLSRSGHDQRQEPFCAASVSSRTQPKDRPRSRSCLVTPVTEAGCRGESCPVQHPSSGQGCRVAMLDPDSGLSLTIARIVQRLKGSSLHSQLERQARVSPDLAPCPQARLPCPFPLPGLLFPAVAPALPSPCGLLFLPFAPLPDGAGERSGWFLELYC